MPADTFIPSEQPATACLVVIASENGPALTDERVGEIVAPARRAHRSKPNWLRVHRACELTLRPGTGEGAGSWADDHEFHDTIRREVVRRHPSPDNVDLALLTGPRRRKRLLVADMESTIIEQEMIDELADYVGRREEIERITARAMRGELEFEAALRERVAMLAGLDARVLDEVYDKRVTLMPGAETLLRTMKANGAHCALVSGGFTVFTERVAKRLAFDEHQANVLEIAGGKLTGRVREPILGRQAKRAALERIAAARGLDLIETIAVGDGANDLDMLAAAGLGVAFRAKPKVQEAVRALPNGAVINHGDLTALLYLQGCRQDEFVG